MSAPDLKDAEKLGYSRGYAAGLRRQTREKQKASSDRARAAFHNRAFLAALDFAMAQNNWTSGDEKKPIASIDDRVSLANTVANAAMKHFRS